MMKTKIEYTVECDLEQAIHLSDEIYNEIGMTPSHFIIKTDVRVKYNSDDVIALKKSEITIKDYVERNLETD